MRILIVDDEPVLRQLLELSLRRMGHEVVAAAQGEAAWAAMQQEWFRVVISDWLMPELDGLQLCRRVRADVTKDYVYFILLTSRQRSSDNLHEAIAAGVDDFLSKPFERDEITTRLHVADRILGYTRRIKSLEEILPICSYCKNIRNDRQYWQRLEEYFGESAGVGFSHSICPECYQLHIQPQLDEFKAQMDQARSPEQPPS